MSSLFLGSHGFVLVELFVYAVGAGCEFDSYGVDSAQLAGTRNDMCEEPSNDTLVDKAPKVMAFI